MTTIQLSLSEDLMAFLDAQAAREGHDSAAEYVHSLIAQAQRRQALQDLEARLLEGLASPPAGITSEQWESMRREALEGLRDDRA